MSDDHAVPAFSAYGRGLISTPHLDRLASEPARFDAELVTNSICTPSRAMVLTGKHSHEDGMLTLLDTFDGSQQTLAKLLQANSASTQFEKKNPIYCRYNPSLYPG